MDTSTSLKSPEHGNKQSRYGKDTYLMFNWRTLSKIAVAAVLATAVLSACSSAPASPAPTGPAQQVAGGVQIRVARVGQAGHGRKIR